jgi:hypothetical protein
MEFKGQDLLKNVVPGFLVIIVLLGCGFSLGDLGEVAERYELKEFGECMLALLLVTGFIFGYLIDAIASWFEYYILYSIFPRPSYMLLRGKAKRLSMDNRSAVFENLKNSNADFKTYKIETLTKKEAFEVFKCANRTKDKNESDVMKSRLNEYYFSYIFSRNLLIAFFISTIISLIYFIHEYEYEYPILIGSIIFTFIMCIRWRDKAFYYSRQVLYASHFEINAASFPSTIY